MLVDVIMIDGQKEWICKLCSETNVWTRWRYRRCFSNILCKEITRRLSFKEIKGGIRGHPPRVVKKESPVSK